VNIQLIAREKSFDGLAVMMKNQREKKEALGRTDTMNNKMKLAKKHPNVC